MVASGGCEAIGGPVHSPISRGGWVQPLCWSSVVLDGFDLVALAVVLPVLLDDHVWGLTPASASAIATVGLVGMTIGALMVGTVAETIGRRKALILSVACFSLFTLLSAAAPSATAFSVLRFLAGLGLGGCIPAAVTTVAEYKARRGQSSSATTTVMTGFNVGAVLCAILGMQLIPVFGWRVMFVAGALPACILIPLMMRYLPESDVFRASRRAEARAAHIGRDAVAGLFRDGFLRATLAFWVATFMGLMLIYGLNTWLPEIMHVAGYSLGHSLGFLLTLNLGAILGYLLGGRLADRKGVRVASVGWFCGAAVFLALFSLPLPEGAMYVVLFLAGFFVFSSQALVYAYTQRVYPDHARATGVSWTAGVGRLGAICGPILGGALLSTGIAYPWGFYVFAVVGVLGAVAVWVVPVMSTPQVGTVDPHVEPRSITTGAAPVGDAH
ncbi:MAG: MFS transporter [Actinomycetes bacterium]